MKNLKKVLALGLALVMILGMFTIASAAETKKTALDFTDWDEVEHKDAVALAVDLGIINGKPDGTFDPKGTIDRASWAKLVYFTATGDDNADAYLGTATGMKDITGNWAESYINYLVANKYVSGDGLGNYMPNGTVTVAAGLKTMLTVLGYDADDRGYQNDTAWMGNIMTDAKRNGLMDDVDRSQTAAVELTRENAAQIVYNALQANTVESESRRDNGESYVVSYTKGATLGYDVFSILKLTGTVTEVVDGNATFNSLAFDNGDAANNINVVSGKVKASAAVVGEEVSVFVKCTGASFSTQTGELGNAPTVKELVSTTVAKSAATPAKTFTGGVTIEHIIDEAAAKAADKKGDFVGAPATDKNDTSLVAYYKNGELQDNPLTSAKRGDVVEVYTNGDGKVTTIKMTEYKVAKVTGAAETKTRDDELQVRVPGVIGWTTAENVEGYQGLAEDDIVLYYTGAGTTVIEKAEKVTGKVNRRNGSSDAKLTMNGTQYQASGLGLGGDEVDWDGWKVADLKDNEYDFYLDKNGSVCWVVKVSGEVETAVAYVLDAAWVGGIGGLNNSTYLEAELLFADDATTEIVRVAKVGDDDAEEADAAAIKGKLIDFSVNAKGNYEIEAKTSATELTWANGTSDDTADKYPIASQVKFNGNNVANDKTVFLVEKVARKANGDADGDAEYFVYTGYKNVPKMNAYSVMGIDKDGVVTYTFISTTGFVGDGNDGLIWIKDPSAIDRDDQDRFVYEIVGEDGVETTMALAKEFEANTQPGFFKVTSVSDEGNTVKAVEADDIKTLASIGNGIVTNDTTSYAYDNSTVCVVIDLEQDAEGEVSFVDAGTFAPSNFTIEKDVTNSDGSTSNAPYTYQVITVGDADAAQDFIYIIRTAVPVVTTPAQGGQG